MRYKIKRRILINGLQLGKTNTGVQDYTQQLYNALKKIETTDLKLRLIRFFETDSNSRLKRVFYENLCLPAYLRKNNYNLFHSPNYVLPYFINTPSILTIHDLITFDYPELCQYESVIYFRFGMSRSIKKAAKIIAVSETVKNDIIKHFNVPAKKIAVIYHGINTIYRRTINETILIKYHLPEKYILFVGNIEPKKNLERLIRAFDLLKRTTEIKHKLVIVGKKGWRYNSVYNTIENLKINKEIVFTGYVPEEDLPAIYSMADLFIFPSIYEGFGFPPLEAMACGVPVIVSDKGSLPEITGGKCLQVNPYNVKEISRAMHNLIVDKNLRGKCIFNGARWVKQFSWEKAAIETLKVYEQAFY